jgi:hypothetical protein
MIKYSLVCERGHEFESWFRSASDFDEQAQRALVECPTCRSTRVAKAIMSPSVVRRDRAASAPPARPSSDQPEQPVVLLDEQSRRLRASIKDLHEKIAQTTVNVGDQFVDQARRMHEGELPVRGIRGQATLEEAKSLWESGAPVLPIPQLPDEQN